MTEPIKKIYYTISEVCEKTDLKQYVLRYWETEFDALKPLKNRSGNRVYTEDDIDNILKIKKLLYEDKFTIEGAKKRMLGDTEQLPVVPVPQNNNNRDKAHHLIEDIRLDIETLLKQL